MVLRALALVAALFATPALAAPTVAGDLRLVDLTDDFATVWTETETLPDAQRAAAFKARFAPILPGFYAHERTASGDPIRYDARLLRGLKAYPGERAGIAQVSQRFDAMFQPALKGFETRFGPMTGYPPIYLVHSLGEFDGGTRELSGRPVLLFGADMIARLHMGHDIQPFFHHELFHLYHQRHFAECAQVWCSLWTEGLATYAAKSLNPKAPDEELLLTVPEPIRPAVEAHRAEAVCAVVARLDAKDDAAMGALFSFERLNANLPPRFGYYVGLMAASEMGRTRSLQVLAQMKPPEVRRRLEATLRRLAACPS